MKKLENLLSQEDFKSNWKAEQAKKTKRTETGLDILKESADEVIGDKYPLSDEAGELSTGSVEDGPGDGVEEIIPEGPINDFTEVDVDHIINELSDLDDGLIDDVVNYLREILLELEQNGEIEDNFTDDLDDQYEGDWPGWIEEVLQMTEVSEDAIKGVSDIIFGGSREDRIEEDIDDVECPDCEGAGVDEDGDECERCDGEGRIDRPSDIPPDDWSPEYDDDDDDDDLEDDDEDEDFTDPAGGHGLHSHI